MLAMVIGKSYARNGVGIARINAARRIFPSVWMHAEAKSEATDAGEFEPTTADGLEALGWYHEKWDEARDIGLGPEHDWASHGADSFGLMAIVAEDAMRPGHGIKRDGGFRRRGSAMAV